VLWDGYGRGHHELGAGRGRSSGRTSVSVAVKFEIIPNHLSPRPAIFSLDLRSIPVKERPARVQAEETTGMIFNDL